ncbi:MAG: hypothetical protein ACQES4_10370 [Bacillota bacterium]
MDRYFITSRENEVLDVNAHNSEEQEVIKHPGKGLWAVRVLPDNQYVKAKLSGKITDSLPDDWN